MKSDIEILEDELKFIDNKCNQLTVEIEYHNNELKEISSKMLNSLLDYKNCLYLKLLYYKLKS
jgi:hypothetical protein